MPRPRRRCLPCLAMTMALAAALLAGAFGAPGGTGGGRVRAQEAATPVPAGTRRRGYEVLLQATLDRQSAGPAALQLLRLTLEPGAESPLHAHPGPEFGVVESGTLTVRVTGRAVLLTAVRGAAGESGLVPVGVDVVLGPGDRIAYAPGTQMTFRNAGQERTTLLAATILPTGVGAPPGVVWAAGRPSDEDVAGLQSQLLGQAVAYTLGEGRYGVTLERLSLTAGSSVPSYPGPVLVAVEEGALAGSVLGGAVELPDTGTPVAPETVGGTPETSFSIGSGEFLFFPEGMAQTPPLGGDGTVGLLRLGIVPVAADFGEPTATAVPPTSTPLAGVVPLAVGSRVVVAVQVARLRAEPSLEGPVLDGLEQGRVLIVTGAPEQDVSGLVWYPVKDANDSTLTGFVAADLIAPEG